MLKKRRSKYIEIEGKTYYWMNWCTGYYTREFCKNKIKELKDSNKYPDVRFGSSSKDGDKTYYRIQVLVERG